MSQAMKSPRGGVPAAAGGPVPRVVSQNERAPDPSKYVRYKISFVAMGPHVEGYSRPSPRYILAATGEKGKAAARELYLDVTGMAAELTRMRRNGVVVGDPVLDIKELPD